MLGHQDMALKVTDLNITEGFRTVSGEKVLRWVSS